MKLSLQLAQGTTDADITSIGSQSIVAKIGAQLGAVEEVINWGERYKSVVVAKVVSCVKHPNADKLSVCKINDGGVTQDVERDGDGLVQVVCGAPNVRAGLLVAWLPPGSVVPASIADAEPFVLGARELRGIVSSGMLASPSELGISDDHDGILEIEEDIAPGSPFVSLYQLDDTIIDLENKMFTHRPDCFGIIGVARELAGIQHIQYTSPDWYMNEPQFERNTVKQLNVAVESDLVPRLSAIAVDSVTVAPSPIWMQADLTKLGIRPINNIVDITNWLMYMTGQPLHAYDYDKVVKAAKNNQAILRARQSKKGETLLLLNGKTIEFEDAATVLICADDSPIGIGGVMGGADTEVDESTKTIIIEAATFDMYNIRKTAMKYGLFTDAVTRFNKGQSPLQNTRVLARAVKLCGQLAGGVQASGLCDYPDKTIDPLPDVVTDADFINSRLGSTLSAEDMAMLLGNVECQTKVNGSRLTVAIPFWRRDLHLPEDIVEEVGRLHGFNTLPIVLPARTTLPTERNKLVDFKYRIRSALTAAGANEVLSYSFVHKKVLDVANQNKDQAFSLNNALSPNLQYYRLSLVPSLLDNVHKNIKAGYGAFALYELGKVHSKDLTDAQGLPIEVDRIGFVFAADAKNQKIYQGEPYFQARVFLDELTRQLGVSVHYKPWDEADTAYANSNLAKPFLPSRSAVVVLGDGTSVGIVGELSAAEVAANKLPDFCAGFELDIRALYNVTNAGAGRYVQLPRYPKVTQDITLAVSNRISFAIVSEELASAVKKLCSPHSRYDITAVDIYKAADSTMHYTFRFQIINYNNTMTATDVNDLLDAATDAMADSCSATRK